MAGHSFFCLWCGAAQEAHASCPGRSNGSPQSLVEAVRFGLSEVRAAGLRLEDEEVGEGFTATMIAGMVALYCEFRVNILLGRSPPECREILGELKKDFLIFGR